MNKLLTLAIAMTMAACAADSTDDVETNVAPAPMTASTFNNGGGTTKTKSDLEADGYTCSHLEGTTVTLCWKNGSGSYSCDDRGVCIPDARTAPPIKRLPIAPIATAVLAP